MRLFYLCFVILIACDTPKKASKVSISQYIKEPQKIVGTPEREEWEYKIAFENSDSIEPDVFFEALNKKLEKSWKEEKWKFAELVGEKYYSKGKFSTYLYKDIYFDTPQGDLLKNRLSYRLRYRFKSVMSEMIHDYLPFLEKHWPIRCEIQSKYSGQLAPLHQRQIFLETRFEFRNKSLPFSYFKDAPPPPWPTKDFLLYTKEGRYKEHLITPMASIIKHLKLKTNSDLEFDVALVLKTPRTRWHIELKNPFGSATNNPNPNNVFFVSWDEIKNGLPHGTAPLVEVEVEADRSSLDEVQDRRFTKDIKHVENAIVEDQEKLYSLVRLALEEAKVKILSPENKYHRIMKAKAN